MKFGTGAQADVCDLCGADVMTSGRDVLGDVAANIIVDPTPLNTQQRTACVIAGRPMYRFEAAAGGGLGLGHWALAKRRMGAPDAYLPQHRCHGRFSADVLPAFEWMRDAHRFLTGTDDSMPCPF